MVPGKNMVDLIVQKTVRGKWIIKSAFNDSTLNRFDNKETAIEYARDRQFHGDKGDVLVRLGPKKM